MSTQRNYIYKAQSNSARRPQGWYVIRANDKGVISRFVAGPFNNIDQALKALHRS